jgi:site-specific recombinase XerD
VLKRPQPRWLDSCSSVSGIPGAIQARSKAGLKERSFHSLRHYFITELVRRGVGLEAVRTLAGHSNLDMTQRYAHATADDLRAAIEKLAK